MNNVERFKTDLKKLIKEGDKLDLSLLVKTHGRQHVIDALKAGKSEPDKELEEAIDKLPVFNEAYESWYSESVALIRQILPDRLADFKDHFEIPKNRKDITYATYRIQDALKGLHVSRGDKVIADHKAAIPNFDQQQAILKAAQRRFESSLFEIRQLVQADLFDSEIDSARELLKNNFLRAAGAIAGVILEKHLRQVCNDHNISVTKKRPGIGDLNQLLRDGNVIDVPQWRHITFCGDIRNLCDHSKQADPTRAQVTDLIDGTDKILKTII